MIEFALAVFFLIVTPGPGVLSVAGIGSAYGFRAGLRYITGLFIGHNTVALLVISGIAATALAIPWLRTVLAWASVGYLLYLAAKIAFAGSKLAFIEATRAPGVRDGLALQAINPKAYAVSTALFSGFAFMPEAPVMEIVIKIVIMDAIWIVLHLAWLWAGVTLRRLDLPAGTQRGINVAMAVSMLLVVGLAVYAQV
jgi:threonine/homoserine/homoserine lactone efflux protein